MATAEFVRPPCVKPSLDRLGVVLVVQEERWCPFSFLRIPIDATLEKGNENCRPRNANDERRV